MTKVSGSYESVVRGVSEQVPQDRLSGQHQEQVNMISDPVRGLARRHGSELVAEQQLPLQAYGHSGLLANTKSHRVHSFRFAGKDYDISYRTAARQLNTGRADALFCFDRQAKQFIPIVYDPAATGDDHPINLLASGGISAITQIGRYTVMAGNSITTAWSEEVRYDIPSNKRHFAIWVRGGAYGRTFSVTLTAAATGAKTTVSYKTLTASYPELLTTSDIPTSNPDYQKLVNDRVNAYNSEVTKWIGTSSDDIQPENIALKLAQAIAAIRPGTVNVDGSSVYIDSDEWSDISVDDAGDKSLIIGVGNEVDAVDELSPKHMVGKIVQVRPSRNNPELSFYMEAYPKDGTSTGYAEVTWKETAAVRYTPTTLFVLATVENGQLLVSSSPSWLESQIGGSDNDVPVFKGSTVGDDFSSPLPNFLGKTINYLGLFQDRLVVASGAILSLSRTGDYFNFFRKSVLSLTDDDTFEMFSLGSEEDVITSSMMFNKDLILSGNQGHYAISGKVPQTPKSSSVVALSKHEGGQDTPPLAAGNLAFYAKKRGDANERVTKLIQIQPGLLADSPQSTDVSQQLDGYIQGTATEILVLTTPNAVLIRTDARPNGLYVYSYLDSPDGSKRLIDAWQRWEWSETVGNLIGFSRSVDGDILAYMIKSRGATSWISCERFTMASKLSARPYIDSLRLFNPGSHGYLEGHNTNEQAVAFGRGPNQFFGGAYDQLDNEVGGFNMAGAFIGVNYPAYVTPTNPFVRDRNNRAITYGRTTLSNVKFSVAETGGCTAEVHHIARGTDQVTDFYGRTVGSPQNQVGVQPLMNTTLSAFVGGEVRECSYTIKAKKWLPLTITAIEWAGQYFNNTRRA